MNEAKYNIHTYGCQMNVHESEKIAGLLEERGFSKCDDICEADIIVMNTCCVRETAETKLLGHLGRIKSQKKSGAVLIVCGCMTQQNSAAEMLYDRCPFVDIIIGTFNQSSIIEYIDAFLATGKRIIDIWDKERDTKEVSRAVRDDGINAWVNIMYGCNNFCTYCIVPYVRGRERSRPIDDIVAEVHTLLDRGYKQITLLGQNVNSYDCGGKKFIDLLKILDCGREYRLKFMTSHPKDFSIELAEEIGRSKVLSHNLHLPVQAGSTAVLAAMNRHYTREQYLDKIKAVRETVPDIGISSDVMVGFPTETEEDFLQTLDLVRKVRYTNLFMFIYSRRSGTPADKMPQIDYKTKQERIARLIKTQFEISKDIAQSMVGKELTVLTAEHRNGVFYGKAQNELAVSFTGESKIGEFTDVIITSAKNANLTGEVKQ